MLVLYYAPDTCALATHIALKDAGAEYDLRRIEFKKQEQRALDYLAINPKGRVPALACTQGILTETPAMLAYVAQLHPEAHLAPLDDPFAFAQLQAFNSYICSSLHVAHAHRMRGDRWVDDEEAITAMQRKVPVSVGACYAYIEEHEFAGPFVMGESYTIADPYLFTLFQWIEEDGVDPTEFPKIVAHRKMMLQRKPVQTALREELKGARA